MMLAPITTGSDIRNERRKARVSSNLRSNRVDIVVPERDKPGSVASPWASPTMIASRNFICLANFGLLGFLVFNWRMPVIRSSVAIVNVIVLAVKFDSVIDFSAIKIRAPKIPVVKVEMIKKFRICLFLVFL